MQGDNIGFWEVGGGGARGDPEKAAKVRVEGGGEDGFEKMKCIKSCFFGCFENEDFTMCFHSL